MKTETNDTPRTDSIISAIDMDAAFQYLCRQLERDLSASTNEVARIRELLNRAIEVAEEAIRLADIDYENDKFGKVTWLKKEVAEIETEARLDPAPEEPVSIPTDLNQHYKANTLSLNEWRELGPDEVICEGDESTCTSGTWSPCISTIGDRPQSYPAPFRFRTRRPLPTTNHKCFSNKLVDEPKQEEMPLEKEIEFLKERNWDLDPIPSITNCLVYLRDEIQKLKES